MAVFVPHFLHSYLLLCLVDFFFSVIYVISHFLLHIFFGYFFCVITMGITFNILKLNTLNRIYISLGNRSSTWLVCPCLLAVESFHIWINQLITEWFHILKICYLESTCTQELYRTVKKFRSSCYLFKWGEKRKEEINEW